MHTYAITPLQALKTYFGYSQFRPMQAEIIDTVLQGSDVLVLMPTGGGKSVCYQIPALVMPGVGVVVSPLIALMKDQVEALKQNGVTAAFINSAQSLDEQRRTEQQCLSGQIKLLYVSPEKIQSEGFQYFLSQLQVNLIAIDEAHCVSFWGHDFRPEYGQLRTLKNRFPNVPFIALTATADKVTRADIVEQLYLHNPRQFITSFDRPNLSLAVLPAIDRVKRIIHFLDEHPRQAGIIYCLSRKGAETLAERLRARGINAAAYHAGMETDERSRVQEAFLRDNIRVVCATVAFGMGIDKSNVRFVLHYNVPSNIESYYQEIGRAGRDGLPSKTVLFYSYADIIQRRKFIEDEGGARQEVKLTKLQMLQHYAEAQICRRRILLNYFAQQTDANCGNCDVCRHPRQQIDGTLIAQKALSAVARLQQAAPMGVVIDVLRGIRSATVTKNQYDQIKTFGVGKDLKHPEWNDYLIQLIQLGLIEIAYHKNYALALTTASNEVLFNGQKVGLVQYSPITDAKKTGAYANVRPKSQQELFAEQLFERLLQLRKQIADAAEVPPHMIFSDATLQEMAAQFPLIPAEMKLINGVSVRKLADYGNAFMDEIARFLRTEGKDFKPATRQVSYAFYLLHPHSPTQIAQQRNLTPTTIARHLAELYEKGYPINIYHLVELPELKQILPVIEKLSPTAALSTISNHLNNQYGYDKIAAAIAYYKLNGMSLTP